MSFWILKTEPSTYSFDDLQRDGSTVWDGVANNTALIHIRQMQPGDKALIYHSGDERAVIGTAEIASAPYPDPKVDDPKRVVVDVRAGRRLARPVRLSAIKSDPAFARLGLVRQGRLSVMPVEPPLWEKLIAMGDG